MAETCKWLSVCPLRRFERQGKLGVRLRDEYCKSESNWKNCKRFQAEERGEPHPDNMMPDGSIERRLE
jgi:hypothetical protein